MDNSTKAKRPTVADAMGRIDKMEAGIGKLLEMAGAGDAVPTAEPSETKAAEPTQAKQTRVVKLPDLQRFPDAQRAIGVDGTYTSNIALFRLGKDGEPIAKKDGGIRKPTRIRVEDAEFILAHQDEVTELCGTIRAHQASSTEQASA